MIGTHNFVFALRILGWISVCQFVFVKVGDELYLKFSLYQGTKPNLKFYHACFHRK